MQMGNLHFDANFTEMCFRSQYQLRLCLTLYRRQYIIWSSAEPMHRRKFASLDLSDNELIDPHRMTHLRYASIP